MHHSNELTQLELILLQLVVKGKGKWSWYELAQALSRLDVPREPDMMEVLKKLAGEGLLQREIQPGSPRDRYSLTPAGKNRLSGARKWSTMEDAFRSITCEDLKLNNSQSSSLNC